LQLNLLAYWKERGIPPHGYPLSFDLSEPEIGFVPLARSMGVEAARVEKPAEVAPAIRRGLRHPGPFLVEAVLEGDTHPDMVGVRCGQ
jgi:benzoylformate decarboxylase